jgi:hypothetical protein
MALPRAGLQYLRFQRWLNLDRSLELAASRIDIPAAWTPYKGRNTGFSQNLLECYDAFVGRRSEADTRARVERDQIQFGSDSPQQLDYLGRMLSPVVHLS